MPFGLCNAPSTFERLIDAVLEGLLGEGCLVYLDDIVTYGQTFQECRERLEGVLRSLGSAGLRVKPMTLDTDASGAVLSQPDQQGRERVLGYASRALNKPEKNYCVTWRELLGMIFGVQKFWAYLAGA